MSDAFLITGGGSGAKVAEALTHLCGAGSGPDHLHILIIDADPTNGNVRRTIDTIETYIRLQNWPWTVALDGEQQAEVGLFKTHLHCYTVLREVESVSASGLDGAIEGDSDLAQVMKLLYDRGERADRHADGFRARPNVGCLLLRDHLDKMLAEPPSPGNSRTISAFVTELLEATTRSARVPVMVVGSVFGGTGASLMPIARACIEGEFKRRQQEARKGILRWARIMLLPYFRPKEKISQAIDPKLGPEGGMVYIDPDRFLLDASSALQFYGVLLNRPEAEEGKEDSKPTGEMTYLIGSEDLAANPPTQPAIGSKLQVNPAFIEETIGAQAALHFMKESQSVGRDAAVYVLVPDTHRNPQLNLVHLSGDAQFRQQLALLLHLSAFFFRMGDDLKGECHHGLWGYMQVGRGKKNSHGRREDGDFSDLSRAGWFDSILNEWVDQILNSEEAEPLKNAGKNRGNRMRVLLEHKDDDRRKDKYLMRVASSDISQYFCRLLLWAGTGLMGPDKNMIKFDGRDYVSVHNGMCRIDSEQIERKHRPEKNYSPTDDNALVRLLRSSLAVMLAEHNQQRFHADHSFQLHSPEGNSISLGLQESQVARCLKKVFQEAEVTYYCKTYGWSR